VSSEQLTTKELEVKELADTIKRIKDLMPLLRDSKLKYQQIKKKDDSIADFAKEESISTDVLKALREDKNKCVQIIAQNKKKIEEIDRTGLLKKRLIATAYDCEESLTFLEAQYKLYSEKYDTCSRELTQLNSQVKTAPIIISSSSTSSSSTSDFNLQFSGEWIHKHPVEKFTSCDGFMKYRVHPSEDTAISRYLTSLAPHASVDHIDLIFSSSTQRLFHGAIETLEKRMASGIFKPNFSIESLPAERQIVLDSLYNLPSVTKHNREGVLVVGAFHGTTAPSAESILKMGFANLAMLDDGWFGNGIYFTSHPEYAYRYCKNKKDPCLIFCFLLLSNPYPVIFRDASSANDLAFKGKANYKNYGSHYVPVVHYKGVDYRPPDPGAAKTGPLYDEIVIFQETHILPFGIVHLKDPYL